MNDESGPERSGPDDSGQIRSEPTAAGDTRSAIEYDCSPWAQQTRQVLRSLLEDNEVPHAWEGTVLVVPGAVEQQVDDLVEAAMSTARSSLGSARPQVAYEVSVFSAGVQNTLVDDLVEARIPHEWDSDGDLVVHEEDAAAVEEIIDALGEPDGGDELDGMELHERLNALFVSVDRLCRDARDAKAHKGLERTYDEVENLSVPFGVEPEVWLRLHRELAGLLEALDVVEVDDGRDEQVMSRSEVVRDMLRRYV